MSDSRHQSHDPAGKPALRTRLLRRRRRLPLAARSAADLRILATLTELPAADVIAGYVPFGTEPGGPDLPAALHRLLPPGGRLLLPVLLPDQSLDWAIYGGRLRRTDRGLHEPTGPRLGMAAIGQAGLVVVPAVAVDRRGVRLGRGGGSYDRALALASPTAEVVALLHDGELLARPLPKQPHDRRVTAVITPSGGLVRLPAD